MARPTKEILKTRSRELIQKATKSEILFRQRLLNAGIQFQFQLVIGFYITDFFIKNKALIIELDGSVHDTQKLYDARRDKWLSQFGFTIWRIQNEDALTFDLGSIARLPKGRNVTNMFHQANIERNRLLAEQNAPSNPVIEVFIRKEGHKSGFIRQLAPLTNGKKNVTVSSRTIRVVKKRTE